MLYNVGAILSSNTLITWHTFYLYSIQFRFIQQRCLKKTRRSRSTIPMGQKQAPGPTSRKRLRRAALRGTKPQGMFRQEILEEDQRRQNDRNIFRHLRNGSFLDNVFIRSYCFIYVLRFHKNTIRVVINILIM